MRFGLVHVLLLAAAVRAAALGPHEVLLLVNETSPLSVAIANRYARDRGVPPENVVRLALPDSVRAAEAEITIDDFRALILKPGREAVAGRGLGDRILAWVYSADFPVRVKTQPPMSLHGATFTRGEVPPSGIIATGLFASALFRGPVAPTGAMALTASFDTLAGSLGERMPLPSMSLAYCGARGTDAATALRVLEDGRRPGDAWRRGTVHLVVGSDIRARCRQWQFPQAAAELESLDMRVAVSSNFPAGASGVAGVMMGLAGPDPSKIRSYAPGAMGEHLTSFGAVFHSAAQTKITAWLDAGAGTSAGTVVEPYSIWTKFPHARFFAHQARGCTLLEAYAQSLMCPLQSYLIGDPLSSPGAPDFGVRIEREDRAGSAAFLARTDPPSTNLNFLFLLDGRRAGFGPSGRLEIDPARLAAGSHRLRAVALRGGLMKQQAFAEVDFDAPVAGRAVTIENPRAGSSCDGLRPLTVRVAATGTPRGVGLFAGGRKLAETTAASPADLRVDPAVLGRGPVELQALAVYADGGLVRSRPVGINLAPSNRPPRIDRLSAERGPDGTTILAGAASDADGDVVAPSWHRALGPDSAPDPVAAGIEAGLAAVSLRGGEWSLTAHSSSRFDVVMAPGGATRELTARWIPARASGMEPVALAFRASSSTGACFFGWLPERSAWAMGVLSGTNIHIRASRGVPACPATPVRLGVRVASDGATEGVVDDDVVCRMPGNGAPLGRVGFVATRSRQVFADAAVGLDPAGDSAAWRVTVPGTAAGGFWLRAHDGFTSSWKKEPPR